MVQTLIECEDIPQNERFFFMHIFMLEMCSLCLSRKSRAVICLWALCILHSCGSRWMQKVPSAFVTLLSLWYLCVYVWMFYNIAYAEDYHDTHINPLSSRVQTFFCKRFPFSWFCFSPSCLQITFDLIFPSALSYCCWESKLSFFSCFFKLIWWWTWFIFHANFMHF